MAKVSNFSPLPECREKCFIANNVKFSFEFKIVIEGLALTMIRKNLNVLFLPFLISFVLLGGKTPLTFLPVFIAALTAAAVLLRRPQNRPVPVDVTLAFFGFFVWCWTGLLTGAPLDLFLFGISKTFLCMLVGVLACCNWSEASEKQFENLLVAFGTVETISILFAGVRGRGPQFAGVLGNSLHTGILLPITLAVLLVRIARATDPRQRAGWALWSLCVFAAIFYVRSRTGSIAAALLVFYFYPKKCLQLALASFLFLIAFMAVRGKDFWLDLELDSLGLQSTLGRVTVWRTAIAAIANKPFMGFGVGNFESAYQQFQYPANYGLHYSFSTIFAHNGFLQVATETGIPGALILFGGFLLLIKKSWSILFRERLLFSILLVFFLTSLINYSLFLPFNAMIFSIAIGFLAAKSPKSSEPHIRIREIVTVLAVAASALLIFLSSLFVSTFFERRGRIEMAARLCPVRSDAWYQIALKKIEKGENPLTELNRSLVWNDQIGFTWQRKALVLVTYHPEETALIDECFAKARKLQPHHAPFYVQEGLYRVGKGQYEAARELISKAAELEPDAPVPHKALALLYRRQRNDEEAEKQRAIADSLTEKIQALENDPVHKYVYRELFSSNYARFLLDQEF